MIHRVIYIRGWRVDVFLDDGGETSELEYCLDDMRADERTVHRCMDMVYSNEKNVAFTYSNNGRSCIWIGEATSGEEFINSMIHEIRHLIDHIANAHGLEKEGEDVAYMSGDAAFELAEDICRLGCTRCRKEDL